MFKNKPVQGPTGQIDIATDYGGVYNVDNIVASGKLPKDISFPDGLISYTIDHIVPGSSATMTLTFPTPIPEDFKYWKFDGTNYVALPSSVIGSNDGDNTITLTLTDGGIGDSDNKVNGKIVDPGAPGIPNRQDLHRGKTSVISSLSYSGPRVNSGTQNATQVIALDPSSQETTIIPSGQSGEFLLKLSNVETNDDLRNMDLYFLKPNSSPVDWEDTHVTWDKYKGVSLTDPSQQLGDVSVNTNQDGNTFIYSIHVNFKGEMPKSDLLIKGFTLKRSPIEQRYSTAIQVVKAPSDTTLESQSEIKTEDGVDKSSSGFVQKEKTPLNNPAKQKLHSSTLASQRKHPSN